MSVTELRALCRGILCCLAATACGGDGPPSLTGGRRVVHLLDHLDTLATVEGEIERPLPAPMERRAGRYRGQLLVQSHSRRLLHRMLGILREGLDGKASGRRVRWSIDVDPIELF